MVEIELQRLGQMRLLPAIERIFDIYTDFPVEYELDPRHQLAVLLRGYEPNVKARQILSAISQLDIFAFRAFVNTAQSNIPIYWNPFTTPFRFFYPHLRKVIVQTDTEFPPPDIILHYCQCIVSAND